MKCFQIIDIYRTECTVSQVRSTIWKEADDLLLLKLNINKCSQNIINNLSSATDLGFVRHLHVEY
jgi:hypothetical protein